MKKQRLLSIRATIFWFLVWLIADIAVLWPNATTVVANRLGIGRGADFVLYTGVAAMFFAIFRLHIKIESLQRDVTKVVREKALQDI